MTDETVRGMAEAAEIVAETAAMFDRAKRLADRMLTVLVDGRPRQPREVLLAVTLAMKALTEEMGHAHGLNYHDIMERMAFDLTQLAELDETERRHDAS